MGLSQAKLGERVGKHGVSRQTIVKWESLDHMEIKASNLLELARAIERSVHWIQFGTDDAGQVFQAREPNVAVYAKGDPQPPGSIAIKVSEVRFRGGPGDELEYVTLEDSEPVTYQLAWLQREGISNPEKNVRRFRHVGDSNEPFLFSGDTILVHLAEKEVRNGRVYAFWQLGEGRRCKQLFIDKKRSVLTIHSFNPRYPDEEMPLERADEEIKIIGRVRDKSGRGGL